MTDLFDISENILFVYFQYTDAQNHGHIFKSDSSSSEIMSFKINIVPVFDWTY